jgi:hypothetical protein
MRYSLVTDNLGFIALTTMVLGTQLFLAGFLGEIILRTNIMKSVIKLQKKSIYHVSPDRRNPFMLQQIVTNSRIKF